MTVSGPASRRPVDSERIVGHDRGHKTTTGSDKTAHIQKESVTSHGWSAFVHETANCSLNESGTSETRHEPSETESRHSDALP